MTTKNNSAPNYDPTQAPVARVFQQETHGDGKLLFAVRSDYHGKLYCVDIAMQNYSGSRVIPVFGIPDIRAMLGNLLFLTHTQCFRTEIYREEGGCHINHEWHPAIIFMTGYQDPSGEVSLHHHLHTSDWRNGRPDQDVTAVSLCSRKLRRIVQDVRLFAMKFDARV